MKFGANKEKAALRQKIKELDKVDNRMRDFYENKLMIGVKNANYVSFAITILCLKEEGWGKKRLERFVEGYFAMANELADNRARPDDVIEMAENVSGINVKKCMDEAGNKTIKPTPVELITERIKEMKEEE